MALKNNCYSDFFANSPDHPKQAIGYRWPCVILGWLVVICKHLWQKILLNDNNISQFLEGVCLKAKPLLFDRLITIKAVLAHQQPERLWQWSFFMVIYGKRWHWMTTASLNFWHEHVSRPNHHCSVLLFDNYDSSFGTSTTWKTVKMAIFMAFYGKNDTEWQQLYLIFWHEYISESNQYCYSCFFTSATWKTVKIAIFMTFYGKKWHWMTTAPLEFWHEYVSESYQYCLTICHLSQLFFLITTTWKTVKMAIFMAFYGNKWHLMTTASLDLWHEHVSRPNHRCSTVW